MDRLQHSFDNFGLHAAATAGNDEGVRRALEEGANVNALDAAGRTTVMCAVAGEHWDNTDASDASFMTPKRLDVLRMLLAHPDISLLTLNVPQSSMNGVIPLGMAAWLNMVDAVRVLLEDSAGMVSVDGMDSHGATALMYASRDGSLDVVQLLLSHGARPDFRDCNHRTSVQFALPHPQILWLCEMTLRRHRWRESQSEERNKLLSDSQHLLKIACKSIPSTDALEPPVSSVFSKAANSRATSTLISAIASTDLTLLHSLLFSPHLPPTSRPALYRLSTPVLINYPDSQGWSPIHHCVAADQPSFEVLDALYCAGADVALFTIHEHYTPLHILAQVERSPHDHPDQTVTLCQFAVHLIRDLRAPLSARDKDDETCIHIAAERGGCIDLLMVLLHCDSTGSIRELRNSRGLTALDVARPDFRAAFGADAEKLRSVSSLSTRTIRATESFTSLVSFSNWTASAHIQQDDGASIICPSDFDVTSATHELLTNLSITSPSARQPSETSHCDQLEALLTETTQLGQTITRHFQAQVEEVTKELRELRSHTQKIVALQERVSSQSNDRVRELGLEPCHARKRDSEDSQATAVSTFFADASSIRVKSASTSQLPITSADCEGLYVSVAVQTRPSDLRETKEQFSSWSHWLDGFILGGDVAFSYHDHHASLLEIEREIAEHQKKAASTSTDRFDSPSKDSKLKHLLKKKARLEEKLKTVLTEAKSGGGSPITGASKLRAWLRRKITPEVPSNLQIFREVDEEGCCVGREIKREFVQLPLAPAAQECDIHSSVEAALRTSSMVLGAAMRDLFSIEKSLASAEQFISLANRSISRSERIIKRAVKKREAMLTDLRSACAPNSGNGLFTSQGLRSPNCLGYSSQLSLRPSASSLASAYSDRSSCVSIAATVTENDEDTRAIRRLLLRKIEAGTCGAWEEMDKVMEWLHIVKEVVRGVKRRAYL